MIDVTCLLHGDYYDFQYVEKLRSMVSRNLSTPIQFHVFTESSRHLPSDMIRHDIEPWADVQGRKSAWWYKMQIFDPRHNLQQVLYLDLDVVVTNSLDWIKDLDQQYFWSIRDFRYLWRSDWKTLNSSLLYFNAREYHKIWEQFSAQDLDVIRKKFPGDQDYLSSVIDPKTLKWVDESRVKSWRWQVFDGGIDTKTRRSRCPGQGSQISKDVSLVIFHGIPKPHQTQDNLVHHYWTV